MSDNTPDTSRAVTDVPSFVGELDGGVFEHMLSIALSEVAAATIDHEKQGEVQLRLKFERIPGTHQVRIAHSLKFTKPTSMGKSSEETDAATVMHVGKFGRLTINQPSLFDKHGQPRQSPIPE